MCLHLFWESLSCEHKAGEGEDFVLIEMLLVTYFALLPVQVKLMLTNCHYPDGLDERRVRIPRLHKEATLPKGSSGYRNPERLRKALKWSVSGPAQHKMYPVGNVVTKLLLNCFGSAITLLLSGAKLLIFSFYEKTNHTWVIALCKSSILNNTFTHSKADEKMGREFEKEQIHVYV